MAQKMYTKEDLGADAKYYSSYVKNMGADKTLFYGTGGTKQDLMKDPKLTEGGKKFLMGNKEESSKKISELITRGGVTEKTMSQFRDYLNSRAPVAKAETIVPIKMDKLEGKEAEVKPLAPLPLEGIVNKTTNEMAAASYKTVESSKTITVGNESVSISKFMETENERCKTEASAEINAEVGNKLTRENYKLEAKDMSFFQRVGTFLFGWAGYMPMDSKKIENAVTEKTAGKAEKFYNGEEFAGILRANNMVFNKNDSSLYEKQA